MAYGDSFKQFILDNNIPVNLIEPIGPSATNPIIFLNSIIVDELIRNSFAVHVPNGGLIIGKFHAEGGIHMLQPFDKGFQYVGEMEGYEFLFSAKATKNHWDRINALNKSIPYIEDITPKPEK